LLTTKYPPLKIRKITINKAMFRFFFKSLNIVIFLIFSGGYLVVNNKGNIQRVESAIYTDKTISEKFGEIKSYSIRSFGSDHYYKSKLVA
jgi:hypothetical protein